MEAPSDLTYAISLLPRAPNHEMMELLQSYLDPSRNAVAVNRGACPDCAQVIDYVTSGVANANRFHAKHRRSVQLHVRPSFIRSSAARGCHVCSLLLHRLQERLPTWAGDLPCPVIVTRDLSDVVFGAICLVQPYFRSEDQLLTARRYQEAEPTSASFIYSSTASDKCIELGRSWLQNCVMGHGACAERRLDPPFIPTRLLKIEANERADSRGYTVRLCEDMGQMGSSTHVPTYVALSHRWGEATPYVLDRQSGASLRKGIPISALPRTFKDAILVTAMLGYSWIWIDCLCIVQDSIEDWEAQAQLMGSVYSHCHLNLAALDATDCRAGLFSRRDPRMFTRHTRRTRAGGAIDITHNGMDLAGPERGGWKKPWLELLSRGWVVQEVLLSRRTLYYCKDILYWECRSKVACERRPELLSHRDWLGTPRMGKTAFEGLLSNHCVSDGMNDFYWGQLICRYSGMVFTYWKDRYYAFLGLANAIENSNGDVVTAGLRKSNLLQDLTWRSRKPCPTIRQTWLPSWSWMSLSTEIYSPYESELVIKVVYADVEELPAQGFRPEHCLRSRSASGHMTLRAPVTKLSSWQRPNKINFAWAYCSWGKVTYAMDLHVSDASSLHIIGLFQGQPDWSDYEHFFGLIVRPCVDREGYWERVGCSWGRPTHLKTYKPSPEHVGLDPEIDVPTVQAAERQIIRLI
jgi:hypothetical protein